MQETIDALVRFRDPLPAMGEANQLDSNEVQRQRRFETLRAVGLFVFTKGGFVAVAVIAAKFDLGLLTAGFWFWGWLFLSGVAFPEASHRQKLSAVVLGSCLFAAGFAVYTFGWSGSH